MGLHKVIKSPVSLRKKFYGLEFRFTKTLTWSFFKALPDPQKQADELMKQVEKDVEAALQNVSFLLNKHSFI